MGCGIAGGAGAGNAGIGPGSGAAWAGPGITPGHWLVGPIPGSGGPNGVALGGVTDGMALAPKQTRVGQPGDAAAD